ncbi:MAG: hypothetical protein JSV16_15660, partial [Candidatus Hydrogenedentota bacterium]
MSKRHQAGTASVVDRISEAAGQIQEPSRTALREFLHLLAASNPEGALRCANNALGILHQLSQAQQSLFLAAATGLADTPEAAAEFFCRCADLLYSLDESDLRSWVEQGRTVGLENPKAAVSFFRQESLASVSALQRLLRSVHIGEVSRLLQLYSTAIAGRPVGAKSTAEASRELVREGHHLPLTDGKTIYLPDQLKKHPSHEENFEEYKVLAAHQAGYIEFGTFELDIDVLLDHPAFDALMRLDAESGPVVSHYELFFRLFDDPQLARDIFFAIEDGRIDFRLREKYRGLAGELMKVALAALDERPLPSSLPLREALVESLVRLSISGRIEESLPEGILPLYRYICRMFSRILNSGATVTDSAVATARIYAMVRTLPNVSLDSPVCPPVVRTMRDMLAEGLRGSRRFDSGIFEPVTPENEAEPYRPILPVPYRGQTRPELVQLEMAIEMLREADLDHEGEGIPLTREMLEELLRRGVKIKISRMTAKELAETSGL